jgi:dihydroorotate dehydrogenase
MLVGATCVQVGSSILYDDLRIFPRIIKGLEAHMKEKGYTNINKFKGNALGLLRHVSHASPN